MNKLLVSAAALCAATGLLAANASFAANAEQPARATVTEKPHRGPLQITKDCTTYTGLADQHCTITSSNVDAIAVGSRVVYLQAATGTSLDSDVIVVVGPGNYALGHVSVDLATGTGKITLSGGVGRFTRFHARAAVSPLGDGAFAWNGKYRIGPRPCAPNAQD